MLSTSLNETSHISSSLLIGLCDRLSRSAMFVMVTLSVERAAFLRRTFLLRGGGSCSPLPQSPCEMAVVRGAVAPGCPGWLGRPLLRVSRASSVGHRSGHVEGPATDGVSSSLALPCASTVVFLLFTCLLCLLSAP